MDYRLSRLERRNNRLKSKLRHFQLKNNSFTLNYSKKEMADGLNEYKKSGSLVKSALNLGFDKNSLVNSYIEGQRGNPEFREFYIEINKIKDPNFQIKKENEYSLENEGYSWIYTTKVDGKKVSLISRDFDRLMEKVKDKKLPL